MALIDQEKPKGKQPLQLKGKGGRPKGSKNKARLVEEIIAAKMGNDYSPLVTLAEIAGNRKVAPQTRVAAAGKLADFMHQRKGVELPTQQQAPVSLVINVGNQEPLPVTIEANIDTGETEDS